MNRRELISSVAALAAVGVALPELTFAQEKSRLKITGIRLVRTRPKRP